MASIVMPIVLVQHVRQNLQCLIIIIKNAERIAGVIRLGLVLIIVVPVSQISLLKMECVRIVLVVVDSARGQAVVNVKAVLIEHGRCTLC
jgi:hypothetical protein